MVPPEQNEGFTIAQPGVETQDFVVVAEMLEDRGNFDMKLEQVNG